MPKLDNWSVLEDNNNSFLAPELRSNILEGVVYNRDGFNDGDYICTSTLILLVTKKKVAKTQNTTYKLGEPSEAYVEYLKSKGKTIEDIFIKQSDE